MESYIVFLMFRIVLAVMVRTVDVMQLDWERKTLKVAVVGVLEHHARIEPFCVGHRQVFLEHVADQAHHWLPGEMLLCTLSHGV